jgi:hypothetical protein
MKARPSVAIKPSDLIYLDDQAYYCLRVTEGFVLLRNSDTGLNEGFTWKQITAYIYRGTFRIESKIRSGRDASADQEAFGRSGTHPADASQSWRQEFCRRFLLLEERAPFSESRTAYFMASAIEKIQDAMIREKKSAAMSLSEHSEHCFLGKPSVRMFLRWLRWYDPLPRSMGSGKIAAAAKRRTKIYSRSNAKNRAAKERLGVAR